LESGEDAEAQAFEGNLLTFLSPRAFAPGSPVSFAATTDSGARSFEGRAISSKRVDDAHFEVRMRFVNLRRGDRDFLAGRFGN
jgi:hypothetical protein